MSESVKIKAPASEDQRVHNASVHRVELRIQSNIDDGVPPYQIRDDLLSECEPPEVVKDAFLSRTVPDQYPRYTLDHLKAFKPNPADHIAGDGWIRRGASCLLTGGTGYGKSVIGEQAAVCVSAGMDIKCCGGIHVPQPRRVIYMAAEQDEETLKRDVLAIIEHTGADESLVNENLLFVHHWGEDADRLGDWLRSNVIAHAADMIVVDPYDAYCGEVDKNSSESFFKFRRQVQPVMSELGCALLLVAHTTKPRDPKGWSARDSVYSAAGTASLANWVRTSCELSNPNPDQDHRYRLRFGKNAERTGMVDDNGYVLRDVYVERSGDPSRPFWCMSDDQSDKRNTGSKIQQQIIELATLHPSMSYGEIAAEVGCSKGSVSKYYPRKPVNDQ